MASDALKDLAASLRSNLREAGKIIDRESAEEVVGRYAGFLLAEDSRAKLVDLILKPVPGSHICMTGALAQIVGNITPFKANVTVEWFEDSPENHWHVTIEDLEWRGSQTVIVDDETGLVIARDVRRPGA